jgi:predicted NAD-dependent protein-ADP-ribosyltransferase YbiA (DUF1768 family)
MVVSKVDARIEYPDIRSVDSEDIDYDAQLYEIEIFSDTDIMIALGKVKYIYVDKNVLYIPVYLVKEEEIIAQIGLYEFPASIYPALLDEDNDFDISLLENPMPLLYKFANQSFFKKELSIKIKKQHPVLLDKSLSQTTPQENISSEDSTDQEITDTKTNIDDELVALSKDSRVPNKYTILQEIFEEDDDDTPVISTGEVDEEKKNEAEYSPSKDDNWIQIYMRNRNYGIIDNEGGGDCLFATIRDAYSGIGKSVSVKRLRQLVSDNATEETFQNFQEQFKMFSMMVQNLAKDMAKIQIQVKDLKADFSNTNDRVKKAEFVKRSKPLVELFKQTKQDKKNASNLLREFRWMRGVDSLEKFKRKIRTCKFWAETWAINILEQALNVKLIIFSSENYKYGDIDNVLQCGDMVDENIEKKNDFKPKYYIIVEHTGNHYKLITYKNKKILTFDDISNNVKKLIVEKCMEKNSGIYNYIPKFKKIKMLPIMRDDATPEDIGMKKEEPIDEGSLMKNKPSFDESTVFQFYSKSSDKPLPGKGSGERIETQNMDKFKELSKINGWRKVLSNFYMAPFTLDGFTWNSVEHYYHANKFKNGNPEFYKLFTVESKSDISKDPAFAKSAGGKTGRSNKMKWKRPANVKMDEDFFSSGRNETTMETGQFAKYSQNALPKQVLLYTKNAKLQHHVRGSPPIIFYDTMRIREKLRDTKMK